MNSRKDLDLIKAIINKLQIGSSKAIYTIRIKKPGKFYDSPEDFVLVEGTIVTGITVSGNDQYGASTATITIETIDGKKSPDFKASKFPELYDIDKSYYEKIFMPETWIQIALGYGYGSSCVDWSYR